MGADGKPRAGQACSYRNLLFILRPGEYLPVVISAPPSSTGIIKTYFLSGLASRGKSFWHVATQFALKGTKSKDGIAYSELSLSKASDLSPEERERATRYHEFFAKSTINAADYVDN